MTTLEINKRIAELKKLDITWGDYGNSVCPALWNKDEMVLFNWAEDISDAWELFEEMGNNMGGWHKIALDMWNANSTYIPISFKIIIKGLGGHGGDKDEMLAEANTASEAICLAWIKWKQQGEPK